MTQEEMEKGFEIRYEGAVDCCYHGKFAFGDVERVLYFGYTGENVEDTDQSSVSVLKLKDGTFGVFLESEDYTGHG